MRNDEGNTLFIARFTRYLQQYGKKWNGNMRIISIITGCIKHIAKAVTWFAVMILFGIGTAFGGEIGVQTYRVVGVSSSDPAGLNVRENVIEAQSIGETNVVGHLQWNKKGITSSGLVVEIGNSIWRQIRSGDLTGWVNEKYLDEEIVPNLKEPTPDKMKCSGTEPFWSLNLSKSNASFSGSDLENGDWLEDVKLDTLATRPIVEMGTGNWLVTLKPKAAGSYIRTIIQKASPLCTDGMSNVLFPYEIIVLKGKVPRPVYGCCQIDIDR